MLPKEDVGKGGDRDSIYNSYAIIWKIQAALGDLHLKLSTGPTGQRKPRIDIELATGNAWQ